jgi:alkyldihydroxyacetonephosphate synthase
MSKPYKGFEPKWVKGEFTKNSYRSIFKWGEHLQIKAPKESLYKILKEKFELNDDFFSNYKVDTGFDEVKLNIPCKLSADDLSAFRKILGDEFVRTDDYSRLSVAYGKTMYDIMQQQKKRVDDVTDAEIYPDSKEQIEQIDE